MDNQEKFEKVSMALHEALPDDLEGGWEIARIIGMVLLTYKVSSPQEAALICVEAASEYSDWLVEQLEECTCSPEEMH
jgi:hypothetical protein